MNLQEIINLIDSSIKEDANNLITGGGIIKENYDNEVDELRNFINNSNEWLNNYTSDLIKNTQISTLKIKFTGISGYFIEIPLSQKSKVPLNFIHKSTLVNVIRFTTLELEEFSEKISNGEVLLYQKEYEIFKVVLKKIQKDFFGLKGLSKKIANIDYYSSLAFIAKENSYTKPEIHSGYSLEIIGGRHPVIENIEKNFIDNDLFLTNKKFVNIITGPNMGGKSTYLRQNALIILLAHIGSFVPAKSAKISLTDKIFSRIGANDNLFLGNSTFMVEMQEVANILHNSTKNSFVIIDEVGRGTSTYDGMSLAWAILKENHNIIKAKTLFATHYHELVEKSKVLDGISNFCVAIGENGEDLIFLRKIIPGNIKKSYGIEVARLAGLPKSVIEEAFNFIKNIQEGSIEVNTGLNYKNLSQDKLNPNIINNNSIENNNQLSFGYLVNSNLNYIEKIIKDLNINNITPIEALNILNDLKNKIK